MFYFRLHDNLSVDGLDPAVQWVELGLGFDEAEADRLAELMQTAVVIAGLQTTEDQIWVRRTQFRDVGREVYYSPSEGWNESGEGAEWENEAALAALADKAEAGAVLTAAFEGHEIVEAFLGGPVSHEHADLIRQQIALAELADRGDAAGLNAQLAKVDARVYAGPALLTAVNTCQPALVRQLLDAGADPNVAGVYGEAAIHLAAGNNSVELLEPLLAAGADAMACTVDGNAWFNAGMMDATEFVAALEARGLGGPGDVDP